MTDRENQIINAAIQVFLRYGVKRAGMNDIAAEAGISRQTLYNAFPNKDEVLKAAIRLFWDRSIAEIEAKLPSAKDLSAKLDLMFNYIAVIPYDMLRTSPNSEDVIDGFNAAGKQEIEAGNERYRYLIETILREHALAIQKAGLDLHVLSDFTRMTAAAAKDQAQDESHLSELLTALKGLILNAVDG